MTLAVSEPLVDVARRLLVRGDDGGPPINRNDVGFSASDYGMVRRVVNVIDRSGRVSDFDRKILGGVLRKYRRQMSELGFDPADVLATVPEHDGPVPVRDVIPHAVSEMAHAITEEIDVADALRTDPEGFLSGLDGIAQEMAASLERATQPAGARSVWEDDEPTPVERKPLRAIPAITTVLGPDGLVAKSLPGYEPRYPQIKLSQAIADAISKDQSVLAEAGTGVGKSIAYLIPLIYSGAKVIVSTEGKALQDQLANKDLPYLQSTLPVRFTFAKLKGISNYLCVAGETGVVTRYGVRRIIDLVGQTVELLDGESQWTPSEVREFGVQHLMKLTLRRNGRMKEVFATADHRWFVQPNANYPACVEATTATLHPGDKLAYRTVRPLTTSKRLRPSRFGIAHGIVYGDGTSFKTKYAATSTVVLHGKKNRQLMRYFFNSPTTEGHHEGYAESHIQVWDLPRFFRDRPSLDESPSYLYGWLAGYFAADGSVGKDGHAVLWSASRSDLEFARDVCIRLGITTQPITTNIRKGKGREPSNLHGLTLVRHTIGDDFFLLDAHRQRPAPSMTNKRWRVARRWEVVSVEPTDRVENVYCAIVPSTRSFVLEDGLLTGNCLRDLNDEASQRGLLGDSEEWTALNAWLDRGADTEGDLADSPLRPGSELRPRVTTSSEDCTGRDCAFYDRCYAQRAKQKAKDADVVVVNHALLCLDIALRGRTDDGVSILPDRRVVVVDEAHALPGVAVSAFTVELSNWTVPTLCRGKLPAQAGLDPEQLKAATDASAGFFAAIGALVERERGTTTVVRPTPGQQRLAVAVAGALRPLVRAVERAASGETLGMPQSSRLSRYAERIAEAADRFQGLMAETGGTHVLYAEQETGKKGSVTTRLARAPVSIANDLHAALWSKWPVVATSATITTPAAAGRGRRGSPFDFFRDESGVKDAREVVVESPFDYQNNALIYTPADADAFDPSAYRLDGTDAYFDRLTDRILDLLEASDGRAFVLFTSRRALNEVRDRVLRHRGLPWTTFFQGDAAPQELVRRFKDDGHAILYGTRTFWTGVDVQGDALSQVILDKLPFPSPEEPVYQAKCDKLTEDTGDKWAWFNRLAIPNATITFKQGIGRLIRTGSDRGVMSLLDGRLVTKGYGAKVLDYLPRARRTSSLEDVRAFFLEGQR
jgi:ATP-dependent DNA helicase DinG